MADKLRTAVVLFLHALTHPRAALFALRARSVSSLVRAFLRTDSATLLDLARFADLRSSPATLENLRAHYHDIDFSASDDPRCHLALMPSGESFLIRQTCGWQDVHTLYETFVRGIYASHPPINGALVLDIGANIGDTIVFFGTRGARVVAYEPDPEMCALARRNAERNGVVAQICNSGVGGNAGMMRLSVTAQGADPMSTTLFPGTKPVNKLHVSTIPVRVVAFTDVLAETGAIRLVKFDCQGCEYPALLSLTDDGLLNVEHIIMEYHGLGEQLADKLRRAGFCVRLEGDTYMFADRAASVADIA